MASSIVIAAYGTAFGTARKGIARLFGRLNYNRSSIREHFSHSVHDLVRIVAHSDHRVGADFACVLDHYFESFGATSQRRVNAVMFPPTSVCSVPPSVPKIERER